MAAIERQSTTTLALSEICSILVVYDEINYNCRCCRAVHGSDTLDINQRLMKGWRCRGTHQQPDQRQIADDRC